MVSRRVVSCHLARWLCAGWLAMGSAVVAPAVLAQEAWNPFKEKENARPKRQATPAPAAPAEPSLRPMDGVAAKPWQNPNQNAGQNPGQSPADTPGGVAGRSDPSGRAVEAEPLPPLDAKSTAVERGELQPVVVVDGTGLPLEFWQGLDAKAVEALVARLEIPPRSAALFALWRKLWISSATPPGGAHPESFEALRLEALYRSGLVAELTDRLKEPHGDAGGAAGPHLMALRARVAIGAGDREQGCRDAHAVARSGTETPKQIKAEMLLLSGYCAGMEGNAEAAGLAADLARAEAINAPLALAALDAFTAQQPFKPVLGKRVSLMDYRFLELAKSAHPSEVLERAEPALLVALATSETSNPALRVVAGEAAARLNVLAPETLAGIYRLLPAGPGATDPLTEQGEPLLRRAVLFKAVEAERTPMRKTRMVRALLDDARRNGLYMPVAAILAGPIEALAPVQEIGWFAETAIEINLAAGRPEAARAWIDFSASDRGDSLQHWQVLADIADPKWQGPRGAGLVHAEQLALKGRLPSDLLHRLATVLDALDYQIPLPLWEAASKTPQPKAGHLPETGVLSQLQDAAKRKEFARTVLLAMRALGPNGAEAAHMIALGDAIRALKRSGLEADARRLGLEAVFAAWPRMAAN